MNRTGGDAGGSEGVRVCGGARDTSDDVAGAVASAAT